jgi:hypothetical protein
LSIVKKKENNEENIKEDFSALTKSYFDGKMRLQLGQNEYNDQLQFEMTTSFRENQLAFNKYQNLRQGKEATYT